MSIVMEAAAIVLALIAIGMALWVLRRLKERESYHEP
jgi:hypothetical protein